MSDRASLFLALVKLTGGELHTARRLYGLSGPGTGRLALYATWTEVNGDAAKLRAVGPELIHTMRYTLSNDRRNDAECRALVAQVRLMFTAR